MLNGGVSNTIQSAQVCYWEVGPYLILLCAFTGIISQQILKFQSAQVCYWEVGPGEWGRVRLVDFPWSDNFIYKDI